MMLSLWWYQPLPVASRKSNKFQCKFLAGKNIELKQWNSGFPTWWISYWEHANHCIWGVGSNQHIVMT